MMRFVARISIAVALAACVGTAATLGARAEDKPEQIARGRDLANEWCSFCHAIGPTGVSRWPAAPPFRKMGDRYSEAALTEALEKGLLERHPAMPPFRFTPDDIKAILAYLRSVEEVRGA